MTPNGEYQNNGPFLASRQNFDTTSLITRVICVKTPIGWCNEAVMCFGSNSKTESRRSAAPPGERTWCRVLSDSDKTFWTTEWTTNLGLVLLLGRFSSDFLDHGMDHEFFSSGPFGCEVNFSDLRLVPEWVPGGAKHTRHRGQDSVDSTFS